MIGIVAITALAFRCCQRISKDLSDTILPSVYTVMDHLKAGKHAGIRFKHSCTRKVTKIPMLDSTTSAYLIERMAG